jgi:hypothetical protein
LTALDEKLMEEINVWREIKKIKLTNIELTNDGIHVLTADTTAMRFADRMTPEIFRTMENLTKLWIKYVDPTLGLPPRDNQTTNPYSRTISAALAFLGIHHITTGQIVDRADRIFKR